MQTINAKLYCLICAIAFCPTLMAGTIFPELKHVFIEPGDLLDQRINIDRSTDIRLEIRLLSPPDGAHLVVSDEGQLKLRWETSPVLPDQTQLMIQARNVDTREVVETAQLNVRSLGTIPLSEIPTDKDVTVSLGPMANQIVSTGRTVSISMNGTSSDDNDPLISIDRVPQNARFDRNPLGGYTLYWQTREQDQGEHVFRVTARHPIQSSRTTSALLTVFVGDPSRSKTVPSKLEE